MFVTGGSDMNLTTDDLSKAPEQWDAAEIGVENSGMERDEHLAQFEIATLAVIFLVTVIGNSTVLLALWTRRR